MDETLSRGYVQLARGRRRNQLLNRHRNIDGLSPPHDDFHKVYGAFLLAGVGFLLPYNSFIIAADYYLERFYQSSIIFDMSFTYIMVAFGAVLLNNVLVEALALNTRITIGYLISFGTLLFVAVFEIWLEIFPHNIAYRVNLLAVAVVAFGCTVQQSSFYGFTSMLPSRYTQAVMTGESAAGLIVSVSRILTKLLMHDSRTNTIVFFGISVVVVVSCFIIFGIVQKSDFVRFYVQLCKSSSTSLATGTNESMRMKINAESTEEVDILDLATNKTKYARRQSSAASPSQTQPPAGEVSPLGGVTSVHLRRAGSPSGESNDLYVSNPLYEVAFEAAPGNTSSSGSSSRPSEAATLRISESTNNVCIDDFFGEIHNCESDFSYGKGKFLAKLQSGIRARGQVAKRVWPYMISLGLAYFVTLTLFPGIEAEVVSCSLGSWMPVILMASFNVCDFIGKIQASMSYNWSVTKLITLSTARIVLIPLMCLCVSPRNDPLIPGEKWAVAFSAVLGLTNGVAGSLPMIIAPSKVPDELKELTGNIMTLSYSVGLTTGSLFAYELDFVLGKPPLFPCGTPKLSTEFSPMTPNMSMQSVFNSVKSVSLGVANYLTPILKESEFRDTGTITPEEFVAAGDHLVHHCPTWQWSSAEESRQVAYLPKDKQFLKTNSLPCYRRCQMEHRSEMEAIVEDDADGGWVDTHHNLSPEEMVNDVAVDVSKASLKVEDEDNDEDDDDDEEAVDIDDFKGCEDEDDDQVDPSVRGSEAAAADVLKHRTYDLHIAYDKYYRTPRLWLFGYDDDGKPLKSDKMFEDFSEDHNNKTITLEVHPFFPITYASIHPCRHAKGMKKFMDMYAEGGEELGVHMYLIVFLKFVQAIIPLFACVMKHDNEVEESTDVPPMPWFGMDIGGTLTKLVYFEPSPGCGGYEDPESETIANIRRYMMSSSTYGCTGHRDVELQMKCVIAGRRGTLHFIRFQTSEMSAFLELAKRKELAKTAISLFATGGGAFKFENAFLDEVGLRLVKLDELETLTRGIAFMEEHNSHEVFYICNGFQSPNSEAEMDNRDSPTSESILGLKVKYDFSHPYPFLVVNIGSGVSILSVRARDCLQRVTGSSLGGGTFLGLCCLLTGCESYEEAIELAARGDSNKVDKLVKDIYGGDYQRFQLSGNLVASSFGQMNMEPKRDVVDKADLARATLVTITNNIGSIARMVAKNEEVLTSFVLSRVPISEMSIAISSDVQAAQANNMSSSYQIRPPYEEKFKRNEVKEIIHAVLIDELGGKCYSETENEAWCSKIVNEIQTRVLKLPYKRYKYVVQVVIGEQRGSGVKLTSRCLWDLDTDNYSSDVFLNRQPAKRIKMAAMGPGVQHYVQAGQSMNIRSPAPQTIRPCTPAQMNQMGLAMGSPNDSLVAHSPQMQVPPAPQPVIKGPDLSQVDSVTKCKALIDPLKKCLEDVVKAAAQNLHQNALMDLGVLRSQDPGALRFDKALEDFLSVCDELQLHLKIAMETNRAHYRSTKFVPIPVNPAKLDGAPTTPVDNSISYSQYLSTVRSQIAYLLSLPCHTLFALLSVRFVLVDLTVIRAKGHFLEFGMVFQPVSHVIFDMDGLLLDSEKLYTEATQAVVGPHGKIYTWDLKVKLMGLPGKESIKTIITELDLPLEADEYMEQFHQVSEILFPTSTLMPDSVQLYINVNKTLLAEFGKEYTWADSSVIQGHTARESAELIVSRFQVPLSVDEYLDRCRDLFQICLPNATILPGVERLVKHLHSKGVPMAIATSSAKSTFDLKMRNHQEFVKFFDPIVMGSSDEEVVHGKPSPDIFFVAAKRFKENPAPEKCLVFEDAPNGVQAAVAANMQVVMIPDPRTDAELRKGATQILESMDQFKPEDFGLPPYDE
ncbi:unnamed protein product [Notodromas monacha]|uniref:Mediator of RNA polymerase II transcription subunit 29 n=1 Tax=Notodromas monacha TaxID=399045 RepID=A0A7R9BFW3_9CRUS|nr:unnamed protein product [Notodromas monacha]CAG0914699.1 unnamed protein product [Notodromas monacha]